MIQEFNDLYKKINENIKSIKENEVILSSELKNEILDVLKNGKDTVKFLEYTFLICSSDNELPCPNQYILLAIEVKPIIDKIKKYRNAVFEILGKASINNDIVFKEKKYIIPNKVSFDRYSEFLDDIKSFYKNMIKNKNDINEDNKNLNNIWIKGVFEFVEKYNDTDINSEDLIKFMFNYESWRGGKSIYREDCFYSPITSALNIQQSSSENLAKLAVQLSTRDFQRFFKKIDLKSDIKIDKPNNMIIFGAPGTGKSYKIKSYIQENKIDRNLFRRVTFHPNYTHSQFVGSYKPIGKEDGTISYNFVGGPFLKTLIEALKDEKEGIPHILVIEEINRANPASVFGDVFQLLDRNSKGKSTYVINMNNEMEKYVNEELGNKKELGNYIDELYIPNNMYIWATMNSADQGVYPMDSAFKRRWSFEYIDIDENEEKLKELGCEIIELPTEILDNEGNRIYKKYEWNEVRKTINKNLKENKVNEDKLLGPFFLSKKELKESRENFDNIFKSKVLMYLYEDILKHKNIQFFKEDDERKVNTLCDIMRNYDLGKIFTFELNEYKEIEEVMENKGDEIK
ncbi:MAG: AAA family ATPase [Clostridium perfringens]|nr:AAA family ATPase [Clostridium perfringens]MDU4604180.1 AAA family ATPase [Clostridium perfringens]MDU4829707.1 AAA family ATPase [Clostridium perfringens]